MGRYYTGDIEGKFWFGVQDSDDACHFGGSEIEIEDEQITVYGDYTSFGTLAKALEDMQIEVQKSSLKRIPTSPVEFSEEQLVDIEKMLDKIEDDDDIQQVFTNIA